MGTYPFREIEQKWQQYWEENQTFAVHEDDSYPKEKRRYVLDMFPYPSAAGLHVGHPEGYTATDIYCRFLRMNGYNVLHPMGFDSFGLPAENYAIETGTHPLATTEENIERFRKQIRSFGFSYDWSREVCTHDPAYYRWTQWIFLQLWKRDLAYVAEMPVWYCEALGTVLANEEVLATPEGPRSERGNHSVVRRPLRQWMLKITAYAERLLNDLDELDWPESIKAMQRNWIGKSTGATVRFPIAHAGSETSNAGTAKTTNSTGDYIQVYTTRPDTLFGATYMVLAPEHTLTESITTEEQRAAVQQYITAAKLKSDLERTDLAKEKTGVFTGAHAINPVNQKPIPIWIADYVLASYGTGAIMAVPAHDERDWQFAAQFTLPIVQVVDSPQADITREAYTGTGTAIHSGQFDGMNTEDMKAAVVKWLEEQGTGEASVQYKLRDWIFSRQRYWGEPIPLVQCGGEYIPIPEDSLPLTLPKVDSYKPTGTGESPLAALHDWVECDCPTADGENGETRKGTRETNTMPQWAGSCWYYLRYLDPHNTEELAGANKIKYWMPVDLYVGGAEHAVLHLLYARFWHKVLYDIGVVNTQEPFARLVNQGMILGEGGVKMSKSLGNVINPDDILREYGADSMRMYEMFMGPLRQEKPWATRGIVGVYRFLEKVWRIAQRPMSKNAPPEALLRTLHRTIKQVTQDTETLEFNTAISAMMIFINELNAYDEVPHTVWDTFIRLLCPYAPHIAEELWEKIGNPSPVSLAAWPTWDESLTIQDKVTIVLQINGKVRAKLQAASGSSTEELKKQALAHERIAELTQGREIIKTIVVPDKIVNIVVKP